MNLDSSIQKRVFIYTRVSSSQQLDGSGLDRQKETCTNFVNLRGWIVARVFTEQESGSVDTMNRPQLKEAISLCTPATGVSAIIVERADRIARDLLISEMFFRECKENAVEVYSADTGEELVNATADPSRIMLRQIFGAVSQWEKAQIAKKLLDGRKRKKAETGFPCGGKPVFGRTPEQKRVVNAILFYHRRGESAATIARRLNYNKHPAFCEIRKTRKWWANTTVQHIIKTWNYRPEFAVSISPQILVDQTDCPQTFPMQ